MTAIKYRKFYFRALILRIVINENKSIVLKKYYIEFYIKQK